MSARWVGRRREERVRTLQQIRGRRPSHSTVVAYLALFLVLTGGVAWALERNSVKSKHIVNDQVKSVDVKDNGIKGRDVFEDSLGQVPRANSATTANSADSATTASNSDTLDGLDSSAFLSANLATINGPRVLDDPAGGGPTEVTLMTAGPVTFLGRCTDTGTNRIAQVSASSSSSGGWIAALSQESEV